jgi:hypothetical protein
MMASAAGTKSLKIREPFDRVRKAVHPAEMLATGELFVAGLGLLQKLAAVLQRHDGVDLGIERGDLVEVGIHHLNTRNLLGLDGARQRHGVHRNDLR